MISLRTLRRFVKPRREIDPVGVAARRLRNATSPRSTPGAANLIDPDRVDARGHPAFLIDHDLITVPSDVRAQVATTPQAPAVGVRHDGYTRVLTRRWQPRRTTTSRPIEPEWDDEQAEEWLRALNTFALEDISIHEAYPGHYVHFLHYDSAPTEVSRRLASYAFTEGWAHYTEQMMWEAGYRDGDPRFRLAQLSEALVRNCRFVCAIRLHAHGMTVDEATEFFVENAFYTELPARKEAERGTFDPGYFSYTLGKLQILRLRDDYREGVARRLHAEGLPRPSLSRGRSAG